MLVPADDYAGLVRAFSWVIPARFNMGVACADAHADGSGKPALIFVEESGAVRTYSFDHLKALTNRFANALVARGLSAGDRVAVFLPQAPETAIAHIAAFKAGMISVPLFTLFGDEALEFRLQASGARALVTDLGGLAKLERVRDRLPDLAHVFVIGADSGGAASFDAVLEKASDRFTPVDTGPDDPGIIIFTSGTTGNPKGALHGHRVLPGHLPCIQFVHQYMPQPGDLHWTPADWAWIGGLFDVLFPSLYLGVPVLAHRAKKFDPDAAMALMADHQVRNVFLPPTALKLLRQADVRHSGLKLRSLLTGGETLGAELGAFVQERLGVEAREIYGQTECNLVVGSNSSFFPIRPGAMGKAIPGHDVRIVDEHGRELPRGEEGHIGIRRGDPVMMLEYWKNPQATAQKYAGDFLLTGDMGRQDEEGYLWYVGRSDDVITSAGYRIGPGEIENCILKHPAVALVAVVGVPDPLRTEAVKAWVVPKPGVVPSEALAAEIQDFVKTRLSAHEYPRHVIFTDTLPMTATGKILRRELRARG
ncbi:acyl-CoA synthetase [Xanthobacter dioxanivorans]|uniref:Acyl-CoA synthetase n=1 Tax=Xanthobacter dioxanivorans TaxID=2528964 RepID=A0A974SJ51_9HYPH|nr:acyl-CoA synthetase [Xanthobacter dioxanivorans]QRG06023.1 acyl-CoA synthetase [Xanthobacter dioxanivorans]